MKIIVIEGGTSTEREVSLSSGEKIAAGYRRIGHDVVELDTVLPLSQLDKKIEVTGSHLKNGSKNLVALMQSEVAQKADFIFNALHGGFGEDGRLQAVLDMLQLTYNGSGYESSCLAMDKVLSKLLFQKNSIPTPDWLHFPRNHIDKNETNIEKVLNRFQLPVIVKPANEGSTVGLHLVKDQDSLIKAIDQAMQYGDVIIENFIEGRELTVGFLEGKPLPVLEIKPEHEIYDYECKYTKGMSSYEVPADIEESLAQNIQNLASQAYQVLDCKGYSRVDLRLGIDNKPYILEVNTLPGMTDTSLVPKAAKAMGIGFEELLERIMKAGLSNE
ncbi:MAG: D-alanine--D-alanine ligase [Candidatus Marinimicrobia bacterium]|nr:D-alanine--D-alanine ligase [Candidatus Neomarinimicrobiota bacterium]